ncbi:hypothetical protein ASPACDRAFT_80366 [Aspergillus aculeatus ATCC 16872]|uniref:Trehalose synthase N-terminal domain-containing protein n=1 Tax=Aspergillus aculeatus (strain ATCC 16872 / CBS 172.66 / WB 5094) TaxID=690307 RepID=A0A1L9WMS6_ASPA1|nr:uncharacterized protein ASPACDRAFT_80366 [Aspergillus aculeatus ATCC 16872]OJJ97475.1 hypothetical protein ASPACDRAFT_80366 [Aspergillus aculeatus ATCC 16872]
MQPDDSSSNEDPTSTRSSWCGLPAQQLIYAGLSEPATDEQGRLTVAVAIRNATQLIDFFTHHFPNAVEDTQIPCHAISELLSHLRRYGEKHEEKFVAVGLPEGLVQKCPGLCSRLWHDLDTLPLVLKYKDHPRQPDEKGSLSIFASWKEKTADEQADSMARKCLRSFGVGHLIHNQIHFNGMVDVDRSFCIRFAEAEGYQRTVSPELWALIQGLAKDLVERKVKIAFFSMTCQGKPVVHTRHALLRLGHILGMDIRWYVPKPRPNIFQLIRKMEDLMEGLAGPDVCLDTDDQLQIMEFAFENARRYWVEEHGPLRSRQQGGADVVVIDSAPLLTLAHLAKQHDPHRPVVFENRLHAPPDVLRQQCTLPRAIAWQFVQTKLEHVDTLVTTLPRELAPCIMPEANVGYMSPSIDQLDGLNKPLADADMTFYGQELNSLSRTFGTPVVHFPREQYILSLSQLRPGDGTLALLDAYAAFCTIAWTDNPKLPLPKLLICHHDPAQRSQSSPHHDRLFSHVQSKMKRFASRICIVQISPQDQVWNTLLSNARVVVQLSLCQGIPEVLLWAMQKQKPVVTTAAAGSFFTAHEELRERMFLVEDGANTTDAVAQHLYGLFSTENSTGQRATSRARQDLPERFTTVGNAACWLFLASCLSRERAFRLNGEDIATLARQVSSTL